MAAMDMSGINHTGMNMSGTTAMMDMDGHDTSGSHNMHPVNPNSTDATCRGDMMMFFHTGNCEYVLFETLRTTKAGEMVGACFAIFFLAMLYEGLKVLREYLLQRAMVHRYAEQHDFNGSATSDTKVIGTQNPGVHMISAGHFIQTLLHMLQVFISYCLMLVFMTYNAWLCIAVVVGAGVGYFLFGWRKAIVVDINEHCH